MADAEIEGLKAEVARLRKENDRYREALQRIADWCPITHEVTIAHQMVEEALAALDP